HHRVGKLVLRPGLTPERLHTVDRPDHPAVQVLVGVCSGLAVCEVGTEPLSLSRDLAVAEVPGRPTGPEAAPVTGQIAPEEEVQHQDRPPTDAAAGGQPTTAAASSASAAANLAGVQPGVLLERHRPLRSIHSSAGAL